jgi:hypothetical protein
MYINKVDDLIDGIINDFYATTISTNKMVDKLKEEVNFIRNQKEINDLLLTYIKSIPSQSINDIVNRQDSYTTIFDTLQRYIIMYLFLTIGVFYKGRPEIFINNIVEFTRNQSEFPLKVNNFFNSESNSLIIKLFYMTKNILILLSKDTIKLDHIKRESFATETIDILNILGDEFIENAFKLKSLNGDTKEQCHNIVYSLIVLMIYKIDDRKNLYTMIEETELSSGEYTFIDIVETVTDVLNFSSLESLLSKTDLIKGVAYDMWDYVEKTDAKNKQRMTNDEKINILINSGIIMPIIDDFLLYHRDNEKYDKTFNVSKKKDDTKIRYIIGKIDSTAELYSDAVKKDPKLRTNILKNFSSPLFNKKAILRNNTEEIKIINKFLNQSTRSTENNDYFNDLSMYRKYAYISFKDFEKYGFTNHFGKTMTSVRSVSFDFNSEFKQTNTNDKIQLRVGAKDSSGNIVGFMIPSNNRSLECIRINEVINIRDLGKKGKDSNGYELFISFLKKSVLKRELHNSSVYWMFDIEADKFKSKNIESKDNVTQQDKVKSMIAELYDRIIKEIYYEIIDRIDVHENITVEQSRKIINHIENTIKIPLSEDIRHDIEKHVFENRLQLINPDDILEDDKLHGLEGKIIKLPTLQLNKNEKYNKIHVDLSHVDETGKSIELDVVNGVCQHNVTWENISKIRKLNYSDYMKQLYNFIQQYVIENVHQDFVCKSCGYYLDIKKYIQDGTFDDEKGFVTFSMPMETNLEDIPEYEKYVFSIKIMDKNIEKIASSVGIPYFVGNTTTVKWRRKGIIKNTIDMIIQNNNLLSKTFKERNESKTKTYGISKALSNLFIFEMENNIYQTSSKDKDQEQFKMIKRNNITTYMMIYIILELNESQISFFLTDKKNLCDIKIFDKIYSSLFSGLRLKKNNSSDTVDITKYKLLCYLIYMISCRIAKHNLWYVPQSTEKNMQKLIPSIQRLIVHTSVDIINSVLENSYQAGVSYIFEVFRVRFYSKLNTVFNDDDYYNILLEQGSFSYATARIRSHLRTVNHGDIKQYDYLQTRWKLDLATKSYPNYISHVDIRLNGISNLSNCPTGEYHNWKIKNGDLSCTSCTKLMKDIKYDEKESQRLIDVFNVNRLNSFAQKMCMVDYKPHQYIYNGEIKANICIKCGHPDDYKYDKKTLIDFETTIDSLRDQKRKNHNQKIKNIEEHENETSKYIDQVIKKNNDDMANDNNKNNRYGFIDNFVTKIQSIIGNEIKGDIVTNLRYNTYIIDHDHNGLSIGGNGIVISENDNKVIYKSKHKYFNTDVLYYTNKSNTSVEVYYDAITKQLIGYRESSRDYVKINNSDRRLKINYSVYNKIRLMGYPGEFINISEYAEYIKECYGIELTDDVEKNQTLFKIIVKNIAVSRIDNLKKTMLEFQRIFNKILNNHTYIVKVDKPIDYEIKPTYTNKDGKNNATDKQNNYRSEYALTNYFSDKLNSLVDKYRKRMRDVKFKESNGKHQIFKHWKAISDGINVDNFDDKYFNFDSDLIDSYTLNDYDDKTLSVLYYLIHQFSLLVDYNSSSSSKTNVCNFIVDFIERVFQRYNMDHIYVDHDIKRFRHMIESFGFIKEIEEQTENATEGIYDEYVEDEEQTEEDRERMIDDAEEQDALDIDMDGADYEEGTASRFEKFTDWELLGER